MDNYNIRPVWHSSRLCGKSSKSTCTILTVFDISVLPQRLCLISSVSNASRYRIGYNVEYHHC